MGYLVKWKGYGIEENTWKPEINVKNAKAKIKEFYKENPAAAQ
jgi:chromobox protein 1